MQHRGRPRKIYIGHEGQDVLRQYLLRDKEAFCFVPAESEAKRNATRREARTSPLTPSQLARRAKARPKRTAGQQYTTESYGRAIRRALVLLARRDGKDRPPTSCDLRLWLAERGVAYWHPHQVRHSAATEIARRYGIEAAATVLGHKEVSVTQIYAQRDRPPGATGDEGNRLKTSGGWRVAGDELRVVRGLVRLWTGKGSGRPRSWPRRHRSVI